MCFVTALVSTYKNIGFCYVTGQPSCNMSAEEEDLFLRYFSNVMTKH